MTLHRRLRRQVGEALGFEGDRPPGLRRLLARVDEEYRRADDDRAALSRALALLSDLARRLPADGAAPDRAAREKGPAPALPRLLRRLFEQAPFAALVCDPRLQIVGWNRSAEQLFGHPAAEAVGRELPALLFPGAEQATARRELEAAASNGSADFSLRLATTRAGEARLDEWTLVPLVDRDGHPAGLAALVREPFARADRFAAACLGAGDGLFDWDLVQDRLWLSDAWLANLGVTTGAALGPPASWLERIHPADREVHQAALATHLDGKNPRYECEHRLRHEDGSFRWVLARGRATRDAAGRAVRLAGAALDVTERKAAADRALEDALHDPLTRLPNRSLFLDLVRRTFARARRREGHLFAVVFLDLDRFKAVNDGLGHAAGDELLMQVAARLATCLREGDTLARQGGDEFTILLDDVRGQADALTVAERVHQALGQPFLLGGHEVFASASLGIALWSAAYSRPEDLLLDADTAMYRAKAQGRARAVFFDASMREKAPQLLDLEADLRRALLRQEFRIHYLPVVDVATGRIQGLEALVRWAHPKRGLVAPDDFVPVAEETGLIVPIGRWLLQQAGRDFQACRRAVRPGGTPLQLHVNVSSRQLLQGDLLEEIDGLAEDHVLDPRELSLELTEDTLRTGDETSSRLAALRRRGVRLCMDDFGAGASSLASLHRVELDSLKIDRSLFGGGEPRGRSPELVRTIVSLARELGKPVVAEGVETAEQFYFLRELGCAAAQGFYFSPPVESQVACSLVERGASW